MGPPDVQAVETEDEYIHVRFADPDDFETIRTPDWADEPANSVVEGAEVRTGMTKGGDDWEIQSVLIPRAQGAAAARDAAEEIAAKIES
jgi:hypothetical protein